MPTIGHRSVLGLEHADTLRRMWRHAHADPETLRQFQLRKLRVLLAHCRTHVAAYREHWRSSKLEPADVVTTQHIEALPTIGKNDLRGRPVAETLVDGADVRRLVRHTTSGSSGQPFNIYRAPREEHLLNLFRLRACAEAGLRTFDRIARFSQLPLDHAPRRWPGRIRQAIGIHREQRFDGLAPAHELVGKPDTTPARRHMRLSVDAAPRCGPDAGRAAPDSAAADFLRRRGPRCGGAVHDRGRVLGAAGRFLRRARIQPARVAMSERQRLSRLRRQRARRDRRRRRTCGEAGGDWRGRRDGAALVHDAVRSLPYRRSCDPRARLVRLRATVFRLARNPGTRRRLSAPAGRTPRPSVRHHRAPRRERSSVGRAAPDRADRRRQDPAQYPTRRPAAIRRPRARALHGASESWAPTLTFELALVDHFPPHPSGKFQPYVSLVEPTGTTDDDRVRCCAAQPRVV